MPLPRRLTAHTVLDQKGSKNTYSSLRLEQESTPITAMQSVQDYALDQIRMRCVRSLVDRGQLILGLAHLLAANRSVRRQASIC